MRLIRSFCVAHRPRQDLVPGPLRIAFFTRQRRVLDSECFFIYLIFGEIDSIFSSFQYVVYEELWRCAFETPEAYRRAFYEDVRPHSSQLTVQPEPEIDRTSDAASASDPSLTPRIPVGFHFR